MALELSWRLDRNDREYTFFEKGRVSASVKNLTGKRIRVFSVFMRFQKNLRPFQKECDVVVEQGKARTLPDVEFAISLRANNWSNLFSMRIIYRELEDERWSKEKIYDAASDDYLKVKPYHTRDVKVFISHSNAKTDCSTAHRLNELLHNAGFTPYIAEQDIQPGHNLWKKIYMEISQSDRLLVLCTADGVKSCDVREEIGIAVGLGKKIIPIVEKGISAPGSLSGLEHVPLDHNHADECLIDAVNSLVNDFENGAGPGK